MKNKVKKAHCAVDYAFQRIGGKYKGRILWVLRDGCLRYGELNRAVVGITPKMLTQTLKELAAGIQWYFNMNYFKIYFCRQRFSYIKTSIEFPINRISQRGSS